MLELAIFCNFPDTQTPKIASILFAVFLSTKRQLALFACSTVTDAFSKL